jgi:hypothetical protein
MLSVSSPTQSEVSSSEVSYSVSSWMNRSTIYERHLQRRLKTIQSINDKRPPIIRVIDGIPIVRMMLSDEQTKTQTHTEQYRNYNQQKHNSTNDYYWNSNNIHQMDTHFDDSNSSSSSFTYNDTDTNVFTSYSSASK